MHGNVKDLQGERYGNLTVLELTDLKLENKRGAVWKCMCDCGNICYKTSTDLRDKRRLTCSCGCMTKGHRKFPNKFVKKETLKGKDKARIEFAERLLEKYKDAEFIDELKVGVADLLSELNGKEIK